MKKILIIPGHTRSPFKVGLLGELIKRQMDSGNEVKIMDCDGLLHGYCGLNRQHGALYCKRCIEACKKCEEYSGFPAENVINMHKVKTPDFSEIKQLDTQEKIKNFEISGVKAGVGPLSCLMTMGRTYLPDLSSRRFKHDLKRFFETEYTVLENLLEIRKNFPFDELHTFNGRMPAVHLAVQYCKQNNIDFYIYERGANLKKIRCIKNNVPHSLLQFQNEIEEYWQNADPEKRITDAKQWFDNRRGGKFQAIASFTADQIKNSLPADFDPKKQNIAVFNSSLDEYYAFDEFKNPLADNENDIFRKVLEHYKNDSTKHFYLRIHPNLKKAKAKNSPQIQDLHQMKQEFKNILTVIEPDEKIDSYALMDAAERVLCFMSSMGAESAYYGKISILAGNAPYAKLDCAYQAESFDELFRLLDDKNLKPKPAENAYPYGYRLQVYGEDCKYYIANGPDDGTFLGHSIRIGESRIKNYLKSLRKKIRGY